MLAAGETTEEVHSAEQLSPPPPNGDLNATDPQPLPLPFPLPFPNSAHLHPAEHAAPDLEVDDDDAAAAVAEGYDGPPRVAVAVADHDLRDFEDDHATAAAPSNDPDAAPEDAAAPATTPKRPRRYTKEELEVLNEVWSYNQTPDLETRKLLAEKIGGGATARTMYIWFQNRRAEAKRKQKKDEFVAIAAGSADVHLDVGAAVVTSTLAGSDNAHLYGGNCSESLVQATRPNVEGDPDFQFPTGSDAVGTLAATASFVPGTPAPAENSRTEPVNGRKRPAASPTDSETPVARKVRRYTPEELELLSDVYHRDKNPDLETRKNLAERIGNNATPEKIYSWFHNRRAEERRKEKLASTKCREESLPELRESVEHDPAANVGPKSEVDDDVELNITAEGGSSAGDAAQTGTPASRQVRLFTPEQLAILEKVWEETEDPDLTCRKRLADELQVTPRHVYLWFKRRRAKLHPQLETPLPRRRGRRSAAELAAAAATAISAVTASATASGLSEPLTKTNGTVLAAEGLPFQLSLDTHLLVQLAVGNMDMVQVVLQRKDVPGTQQRMWWATHNPSTLPSGDQDVEHVAHTVMHPWDHDENITSSVSGQSVGLAGGGSHENDALFLSGYAAPVVEDVRTQDGDRNRPLTAS